MTKRELVVLAGGALAHGYILRKQPKWKASSSRQPLPHFNATLMLAVTRLSGTLANLANISKELNLVCFERHVKQLTVLHQVIHWDSIWSSLIMSSDTEPSLKRKKEKKLAWILVDSSEGYFSLNPEPRQQQRVITIQEFCLLLSYFIRINLKCYYLSAYLSFFFFFFTSQPFSLVFLCDMTATSLETYFSRNNKKNIRNGFNLRV